MNLYKVMKVQVRYMKEIWAYDHGGGGHGEFNSSKKYSANGKEMNTQITSNVEEALKIKKIIKLSLSIHLTQTLSLNILHQNGIQFGMILWTREMVKCSQVVRISNFGLKKRFFR